MIWVEWNLNCMMWMDMKMILFEYDVGRELSLKLNDIIGIKSETV